MYKVKIKESVYDIEFLKNCEIDTNVVYAAYKKDNKTYDICGFEFEELELEFLG